MSTAENKLIDVNIMEHRRHDIRNMFDKMKQYNIVAQEILGRKIRVSEKHWVIDFASCNYLGLDLDPEMQQGIYKNIAKWGVHPSWCRLVASPQIYDNIEQKLAKLIGTEETLILPTVTLISIGVIPALVGKNGAMFLDKSGHETMYEAAKIARDSGAKLESFIQNDFKTLETLLEKHKNNPRKVILVDGVYSMTGDFAQIPKLVTLAKKYDAILYIDDAHGFGVVGESPSKISPYGTKGNGIVRYYNLSYENIIYVGGCSKAYSSLAAFVGCSSKMKKFLQAYSTPYDLSGPCPTASLATLMKGLEINEKRGDVYREKLWNLTREAIEGLKSLGFTIKNNSGFPIIFVHIGNNDAVITTANQLFDQGIMVTVSPFPMVRKGEEGHRITITSANTEDEIKQLIKAFSEVKSFLNKNA